MDYTDPDPRARAVTRRTVGAQDRQQFWLDTCRELAQRRTGSPRVLEFYQKYGCRFLTPTTQQAKDVLGALDAALPGWEKEQPELFFQTLELNFPELLRQM
jgi:hypothetical protein